LLSGCRRRRFFTRFVTRGVILALEPAPRHRSSPSPSGLPNQSACCLPAGGVTNPTSPARSRDPRRANLRRAVARKVPLLNRAPLLRFLSPSAFASSRCAVRGGQAPDDPASAFLAAARPASADRFERWRRPCGFPLCECDAVKLDMRTSRCGFAHQVAPRKRGG
jgi:hypothetical protein